MKLNELLNSCYEFELDYWGSQGAETRFTIEDGDQIHVEFAMTYVKLEDEDEQDYMSDDSFSVAEVMFSRVDKETGETAYAITNGGDALKIFSTVIKVMEEFAAKERPAVISFSSRKTESSRTSFYKSLIKKFSRTSEYEDGVHLAKKSPEVASLMKSRQEHDQKDELLYMVRKDL
jgi:acetamidase/formamidase